MIISIINQKGGVGKTTSIINIGYSMALLGKKVLLVDLDPQANLTSGIGIKHTDFKYSIYEVLTNNIEITQVILNLNKNVSISLIPSTIELAGAEVELVNVISRESILKRKLSNIVSLYDIIFIDCPPSLGLLTINALTASQKFIIPVQAEYYALEGLTHLLNTFKLIKDSVNNELDILGILITMYDNRTNLSKDVKDELEKFMPELVFKSIIPRNIKLSEAPSRGLSIFEYAHNSIGADSYRNLALEILDRIYKSKLIKPLNLDIKT